MPEQSDSSICRRLALLCEGLPRLDERRLLRLRPRFLGLLAGLDVLSNLLLQALCDLKLHGFHGYFLSRWDFRGFSDLHIFMVLLR